MRSMLSTPIRRLVASLTYVLLVLAAIRAYYELLTRYNRDLGDWFAVHPARPLALVGMSMVTAGIAAWWVRRQFGTAWSFPPQRSWVR